MYELLSCAPYTSSRNVRNEARPSTNTIQDAVGDGRLRPGAATGRTGWTKHACRL